MSTWRTQVMRPNILLMIDLIIWHICKKSPVQQNVNIWSFSHTFSTDFMFLFWNEELIFAWTFRKWDFKWYLFPGPCYTNLNRHLRSGISGISGYQVYLSGILPSGQLWAFGLDFVPRPHPSQANTITKTETITLANTITRVNTITGVEISQIFFAGLISSVQNFLGKFCLPPPSSGAQV